MVNVAEPVVEDEVTLVAALVVEVVPFVFGSAKLAAFVNVGTIKMGRPMKPFESSTDLSMELRQRREEATHVSRKRADRYLPSTRQRLW